MVTIDDPRYFDHDADIGIIGRGNTLEACFEDAAQSMFALMADLSHLQVKKTIHFTFEEDDTELAFVTWLNLLIANAQSENLILFRFQIKRDNAHWICHAEGETWRNDIERGIDVKGATLTMLSVKKINSQWEARCIVDV